MSCPITATKQKQVSKGSAIKSLPESKLDEIISNIGPKCLDLYNYLSLMVSKAKTFEVVMPKNMFHFEEDKCIFLSEEDVTQLLRMAFLNVSCIQIFMM